MNLARHLSPLVGILAAGCINVPEVETSPREVSLVIQGNRGEGSVYTPGPGVTVSVALQGVTPNLVELTIDGKSEARLEPPYAYTWNTGTLAEGPHTLQLQATDRGELLVSPERTVVLDRTPPYVVTSKPYGASSVARDVVIQAEFSEPLHASTVTESAVQFYVNSIWQRVNVTLSPDGKTLTVEPVHGVSSSGNAALSLSSAITDLAGNSFQSITWTWNYQ